MTSFKRPEDLKFPRTYRTFIVRNKVDQDIEYRIKHIPNEDFPIVIDMMSTMFLRDETLCSKAYKSPASVKYYQNFWLKYLREHLSLGCYRTDNGQLVGLNILNVSSKNDPADEIEDENVKQIEDVAYYMFDKADLYSRYRVNSFLSDIGLLVNPVYRGCGIATELLKARIPLLQNIGLTTTGSSFQCLASQIAAKKAGFEDVYVRDYAELAEMTPKFRFENNKEKTCRLMAMTISKLGHM